MEGPVRPVRRLCKAVWRLCKAVWKVLQGQLEGYVRLLAGVRPGQPGGEVTAWRAADLGCFSVPSSLVPSPVIPVTYTLLL